MTENGMHPSNLELEELVDVHIQNQEITPLNENVNCEPEIVKVKDGYGKRLYLFVTERKKAIIFRILANVGIGFDIYAVMKKCLRGHYVWAGLSICFLIVTRVFGSLYSVFCEVVEKHSHKQANKPSLFHQFSVGGFATDRPQNLDLSDEEDNEAAAQSPEDIKTITEDHVRFVDIAPVVAADAANAVESACNNKQAPLHGTVIEPMFVDLKEISISWEEFISIVKDSQLSIGFILSHVILVPQDYHFFRTSRILWRHYKESYHKKAVAQLKIRNVKEVSYRLLWNKYCFRKIISKQLSLIMATIQTIPSTLMELLYWSVLSAEISKLDQKSFFDVSSIGGDHFSILELVSLVVNLVNISYRLVSLMKQVRKMNFLKQDMKSIHKYYLAVIYFLLLSTRILSLYLVMCLNRNGLIFAIFLLLYQLIITFIVSWNLNEEGNRVTMVISTLLMLFLYVPPKSGKKIGMCSYHLLMLFEMMGMFGFGYLQLISDPDLSTKMSFLGHDILNSNFYVIYISLFAVFIVSCALSSKWVSRCLFKYTKKMEWSEIKEAIDDVNIEFDTNYELITKLDGNAFSCQHTIDLY